MARGIRRALALTEQQRRDLERARDHDPRPYYRERCAAVLKVAGGQSARQVALRGLHKPRDPDTVRAWLDAYQARGLAGLAQRPRGHRGLSPPAGRAAGRDRPPGARAARHRAQPLAAG
jgi:hypothetical protein